jgi:hypothetical protein
MVPVINLRAGAASDAGGAAAPAIAAALSPPLSSAAAGSRRLDGRARGGGGGGGAGTGRLADRRAGAAGGDLDGREVAVVVAAASGASDELGWALDLTEAEARVVGVLEPVEAPVAAGLEGVGEPIALVAGRDAAVALAGQTAELGSASVEDADAAAGDVEIEVVAAKITASAGGLDDHLLASNRTGCEGEPGRWLVLCLHSVTHATKAYS